MMLLGLLLASWLLLRLERKSLASIGFDQPVRRFQFFGLGFTVMALAALAQQWLLAIPHGITWQWDPHVTLRTFAQATRWHANSVLIEELVFRGYLLYQALRWLRRGALVLSAVAFGIYHWFTFGVIGDPVSMAVVFVYTGLVGFMLAAAFRFTGSIAAPIGLHFGWNFMIQVVFSSSPLQGTDIPWSVAGTSMPLLVMALVVCGWYRRYPVAAERLHCMPPSHRPSESACD
jgi:uncharacterized protein